MITSLLQDCFLAIIKLISKMCSHRLLWLDDNKSAAGLFPCSHQTDIRMSSPRLLWLDDNKSAAALFPCDHQADIQDVFTSLALA